MALTNKITRYYDLVLNKKLSANANHIKNEYNKKLINNSLIELNLKLLNKDYLFKKYLYKKYLLSQRKKHRKKSKLKPTITFLYLQLLKLKKLKLEFNNSKSLKQKEDLKIEFNKIVTKELNLSMPLFLFDNEAFLDMPLKVTQKTNSQKKIRSKI